LKPRSLKKMVEFSICPLLLLAISVRVTQELAQYTNFREKEKEILDRVMDPKRYDSRIRPAAHPSDMKMNMTMMNAPTEVIVNTFVRSIDKIDDYKMEYSCQLTFRQKWLDPRLAYSDMEGEVTGQLKYLTMTDPNKVWMPDTFFQNEKTGHFHNIIVPNVYIRIYPDGGVLYSIRISLTLACPMDLKLYPLDRQACELRIASYGWTTDDLIYHWKKEDPVQITDDLNLPRFKLELFETTYCNTVTNTGEYSCLKILMVFKREFSYYLLTIYVPSCMLVIVSWVSFWLDSRSVPARVALGVTTLLTMSTQVAGVSKSLPPVAYTKAIDVWNGACVLFVFSALLEFAFVNYASRSDQRKGKMKPPPNPFTQPPGGGYFDPDDHLDDDLDTEEEPATSYKSKKEQQGLSSSNEHGGFNNCKSSPSFSHVHNHKPFSPSDPLQAQHQELWKNTTGHLILYPDAGDCHHRDRLYQQQHPLPYQHVKVPLPEPPGQCACGRERRRRRPRVTPCTYLAKKFPLRSKRIDIIARIIFPIIFATFNLCYWTFYLSEEHKSLRQATK